jgi:hypothetical protein
MVIMKLSDDDTTDAQRVTYKKSKKKDSKALLLIHQSVDGANFDNIFTAATFKQAWDILKKCYTNGEKMKKIRVKILQTQYELVQTEDQDS